ncbi:MAG: hypothetical protein LCH32_12270 [Bacteroidetes bacterium]|nr:hypothetical protein [Bacteroidota bacterium]
MKFTHIILLQFFVISVFAQTPKFINYQGLARDASGNPITNQSVALGFTITNGATTPFTDSKNATTNGFGLFNTTIGSASNPINSNLALGNFSLITSVNGNVLTPQILASVPYALNAPEPAVSYSTGVLTIGSTTVPYSSGTNYQAGNGISINSGSIINTAPNQTINIISSNTVLSVSSTYPNYNLNLAPQVFSGTNTITSSYGGTFVIPTSTSTILNGDATGASNSNTVVALRGINLGITPPISGQRLTYNGSIWNYVTPPFSISGNTISPSNLSHGLAIGTNSLTFSSNNYSFAVNGAQYLNGHFHQVGQATAPSVAGAGNGRIYYNQSTNKFMVSEGVNTYVPLIPNNIWTKTGPSISPSVLSDNVGLGTTTPISKLDILETNSVIAANITNSGAAQTLSVTNTNTNNVYYAAYFNGGINAISKPGPSTYGLLVRDDLLNSVFNVQNNGNVGIGTVTPTKKLEIIGDTKTNQIQVTTGAIVNAVLTSTDAAGNTMWIAPVIFQYEFAPFAAITVSTNIVNDLGNSLQFSSTQSISIGGGFNPSTARFIAPTAGQYEFNASLYFRLDAAPSGNNWICLDICKNPASPIILRRSRMNNQDASNPTYVTLHANVITTLAVGDVVYIRAVGASGGTGGAITNLNSPNLMNSFNGKLLR